MSSEDQTLKVWLFSFRAVERLKISTSLLGTLPLPCTLFRKSTKLEVILLYPPPFFTFLNKITKRGISRRNGNQGKCPRVCPGGGGVGLRSHNQNVDKNFKTLKYFFKHPIKNILTIRPLKKFLEPMDWSGRGWGELGWTVPWSFP